MNEIVLVSVADGSVSVVKSLDSGFPWEMQFSPNGRYIAFDLMRSDRKRDIFLLTADGTQETPLVEHPADDRLLGWAPDGNRIVFASDRTERQSIWLIQVDDGKPQGLRQLAGPQMGSFEPLGLTREGSFYFGLTSGGTNIYTAKLDPQTHKLLAPPVMAIRRREGQNVASDWSPDGQYLACLSLNWRGMAAGTEHLLFILSVETNQLQEISTELRGIVSSLRWSPDGRSILCWAPAKPWRWGIQQMDVQTGELTTVTKGGRSGPIWAPDGKAVFYRRNTTRAERGPNRTISIIRREIDTGAEQELYSSLKIANLTVSSDGRHLAFSDTAALKVLSVTGGEPREVAKLEDVSTIAWTRDSRYLLFGKGKFGTELWRVPSEGGEPEKLDLTMHRLKHLRVHPDGQRITFAGQAQPSKNELWVMENFLPEDVGK